MTTASIRKATPADLPVLEEIARRNINASYRPILGDKAVDHFIDSGDFDREIETHIKDMDVLVTNGKIAGFAVYFDGLIHLMMIDVNQQGCGFGTRLLRNCEYQLNRFGHKTMRLEISEENEQALNFFQKNGWQIARKDKDPDHNFTRILLEKTAK